MAVVHSCVVAVSSYSRSDFQGDDIVGFFQARKLPFLKYLATPIDVHLVPLHRLATYMLGRFAPANFGLAVAALLACHLAAIFFLYRALEVLHPTWLNAVLVSWYATHVYIGVLFTWWTSGLHRLPYVMFLAIATHAYVKYRWRPRLSGLLAVVGAYVAGLGFFEKAGLYPLVLAGVEACIWRGSSVVTRNALMRLYAALGAVGLLYFALWRHAVGPHWATIGGGSSFLLTYLKLSWFMLLQSASGHVYDGAGWGLAILLVLVVATVARRLDAAFVWMVGAVVVSICLEASGLSPLRAEVYGASLSLAHRYYPDVMIVFVLFAALACHRSSGTLAAREPRPIFTALARCACPWSAAAASFAVAAVSLRASTGELEMIYANQPMIRTYMRNVAAGLEPLRHRTTPPRFVQGRVPPFVSPWEGWLSQHSLYVEALGVHAHFVSKSRHAYRILPTGRVVFGS